MSIYRTVFDVQYPIKVVYYFYWKYCIIIEQQKHLHWTVKIPRVKLKSGLSKFVPFSQFSIISINNTIINGKNLLIKFHLSGKLYFSISLYENRNIHRTLPMESNNKPFVLFGIRYNVMRILRKLFYHNVPYLVPYPRRIRLPMCADFSTMCCNCDAGAHPFAI